METHVNQTFEIGIIIQMGLIKTWRPCFKLEKTQSLERTYTWGPLTPFTMNAPIESISNDVCTNPICKSI